MKLLPPAGLGFITFGQSHDGIVNTSLASGLFDLGDIGARIAVADVSRTDARKSRFSWKTIPS